MNKNYGKDSRKIFCPICKKEVEPIYEEDDDFIIGLGWGEDPENIPVVPVCPECGTALRENIIRSFDEEEV